MQHAMLISAVPAVVKTVISGILSAAARHEPRCYFDRYRSYFYGRLRTDPEFRQRIHALKGKRLGCFCKPYPCHRDIIKEYLNTLDDE
ncbi:MAG: DUF4326 domain-containing protein [Alistipes shahii]